MSSETLASIIKTALATSCCCHVNNAALLRALVNSLRTLCQQDEGTSASPDDEKTALLSLSYLSNTVRGLFYKSNARNSWRCCRNAVQLCRMVRRCKFFILAALYRSSSKCTPALSHLCFSLFITILRRVPCEEQESMATCSRACQTLAHDFVRNILRRGSLEVVGELLSESDVLPRFRAGKGCDRQIRSTMSFPSLHDENLKQAMVAQIKQEWRKWLLLPPLHVSVDFLNLWQRLVSVRSNLGVNSCRESIVSSGTLVRDVFCPGNCDDLVWRKKVGVLNEVLCYGSTLALQSDVPDELGSIAQGIVREVIRVDGNSLPDCSGSDSFSLFFVGKMISEDQLSPTTATPSSRDRQSCVQAISLLVLKSIAILLRQATYCSSGEESDSSHCSRGCLCDQEADMIERSMVSTLKRWQGWLQSATGANNSAEFVEVFVEAFIEQDDHLVEAMLCLLDIHLGLGALSSGTDVGDFHPVLVFECFMEKCSWDSSVLVDYLLSNETCFLLYFLRLLKFVVKNSCSSSKVRTLLMEIHSSLVKLDKSGLFPYDIKPILSLLSKVKGQVT